MNATPDLATSEHQNWSVEYRYTYRDMLLLLVKGLSPYTRWIVLASFLLSLGCFFYIAMPSFAYFTWDFFIAGVIFSIVLSLVTLFAFLPMMVLTLSLLGFLFYRLLPFTLEISSEGIRVLCEVETIVRWPSVTKLSHQFGLIFIEFKLMLKTNMIVPLRIFEDPAEGERFYTDLNYFWEQGR